MKKLTRKQKRKLIAWAIQTAIHSMCVIGAFIPVGSLGALEVGRIEFVQFLVQSVIGIALFLFSLYAHYKIYMEDTTYGYY